MGARVRTSNFEARGLTQTGEFRHEPYGAAGLNGEGQVVGAGDSGLNDLSCFFFDGNGTKTLTTERKDLNWNGPIGDTVHVDRERRKVTFLYWPCE